MQLSLSKSITFIPKLFKLLKSIPFIVGAVRCGINN
jgi:hypothetical protein